MAQLTQLDGAERLADEVPRQVANAATIWATANMIVFLPMSAGFARLARWLVPDRPAEELAIVQPRYLDDELIQVPSLALERARLELGHMAEIVRGMRVAQLVVARVARARLREVPGLDATERGEGGFGHTGV